ncbi:MAG: hypothetical protein L3J69_10790 [Desulfobacula sp.]|nr:hypothetical protein [Desulfobacula sp.]
MPTLDERSNESTKERNQRLEAKTLEMGITHTFAQYLEQMETYLLALEKRVKTLETQNHKAPSGIKPDKKE